MKKIRKTVVCVLVLALICAYTPYYPCEKEQVHAATKVKKKGYTLNKKSGTYDDKVTVKMKVKKGYKVYYSTNGTFNKKMIVKSGKTKIFRFTSTTKLFLYTTKKSKKITNKKLKKKSTKKMADRFVYKIKTEDEDGSEDDEMDENVDEGESKTTSTPSPKSTISTSEPIISTSTPIVSTSSPVVTPPQSTTPVLTPTKTPDGQGGQISATTVPTEVQEEIDASVKEAQTTPSPISTMEPVVVNDNTPVIELTDTGLNSSNLTNVDETVEVTSEAQMRVVTIKKAGTYVLNGGSQQNPLKNTIICVDAQTDEDINFVWDNLVIDNSELGSSEGEDCPVFEIKKKTTHVKIALKGQSEFIGNGTYYSETPSSVVYAKDSDAVLSFATANDDPDASLTIHDSMSSTTDYGENDPSDGISSKGTLLMQSGKYVIDSNGDCLKGTGSDGLGGVFVTGGEYKLTSYLSNCIKSKNGSVKIEDGTIQCLYSAEDGINSKNDAVLISGGTLSIDQCYGDGIQGETVNISGDSTNIDITTYFINAGKNYYNTSLGTGQYNILTSSDTRKVEQVNVDTGSHKGIKAGTKACSYQYNSVEDGSEYAVGTTYSDEASGGLTISGGTILIDTTNTGIKYNGGGGGFMGGGMTTSGNLSAASNDGQYIIGAPDDAIHSNNTCTIVGGNITISSSDDGLTSAKSLTVSGDSNISILTSYEGIESGIINIGAQSGSQKTPSICVASNDDGINASSKQSVSYVYADESEEVYTKTEIAASDNVLNMSGGYLNVTIADDSNHSFNLPVEGQTDTTGTYKADGDGIDCNGSFYAYGGTILVYGSSSADNSPVDCNNVYYIGNGVSLFACGSNGMVENPTSLAQPALIFGGSSSGGPGGFGGGFGGNKQSSSGSINISANSPFAILDDNQNVMIATKAMKALSYVFFSSPTLSSNGSYYILSGGTLEGELVLPTISCDYRYTQYNSTGASTLATAQPTTK